MNATNTTLADPDAFAHHTLYHAVRQNCGADFPADMETSYLSFWELFAINIILFVVETITSSLYTCLKKICGKSEGTTNDAIVAGVAAMTARKAKERKKNNAVLLVNLLMLTASTAWYFKDGVPSGDPNGTCPFIYFVALPLYKPAAGPLWRCMVLLARNGVGAAELDSHAKVLYYFIMAYLGGLVVAMVGFAFPLCLIFFPAIILLLLFVAALLCAVVVSCSLCGLAASIYDYKYQRELAVQMLKLSSFLTVGLLTYVCAVFGPFYNHPTWWGRIFTGSWNYVAPSSLAEQVLDLVTWPAEMASAAQVFFGVSLGVLVSELCVVCALAYVAYSRKKAAAQRQREGARPAGTGASAEHVAFGNLDTKKKQGEKEVV